MSIERLCANTIRGLAMDAVQAANSGHPGMPMGMADIATVLWTRFVKYAPGHADWPDRDRVVISNGHGSMLLYSALYLTGQAFTLDDLKQFRQWGSSTAGHPELGYAPGIETTTGPLGQGFANAVGMAMAERHLNARFGDELVDHDTYVLCGDGCLMEGISGEAASLAGHHRLGRLVVLYDDNQITIDGSTGITFTEDVGARFEAYGWHVLRVDGHDQEAVAAAITAARAETGRPSLICCRTIIGYGSPSVAGKSKSHGAPLGEAEIRATKAALGMDPDAKFSVPDGVIGHFRARDASRLAAFQGWQARLAAHPASATWADFHGAPDTAAVKWPAFERGAKVATRKAGGLCVEAVGAALANVVGGSADLAESNVTHMKGAGDFGPPSYGGRNIAFGVREHAMAAIANGLSLHGGLQPYCATFLCFHDYMRPSVRLSALMHQPVVYIYTHDSIFLGEDGPTHQPVEHLMAMRTMPGLHVWRPADGVETVAAWQSALTRRDGPSAMCLTRQNLPVLEGSAIADARKGGYVVHRAGETPALVLVATGSEVSLAMQASAQLSAEGVATWVVSLPCWEVFLTQDAAYRRSVLPPGLPRVAIEAGVTLGWERITGDNGAIIGIDRFGASAPGEIVAEKLGLNAAAVVAAAHRLLEG